MKKIKLSGGKQTLVDDEDFEFLNQWKWNALHTKPGRFVVGRTTRKKEGVRRTLSMSRVITGAPSAFQVDHKNGNPLDNRKKNLRICTHSENQFNRGCYTNNKLGLKGVRLQGKSYVARISYRGELKHLGSFKTASLATKAYREAAKKYHKEFARWK